MKVYYLLIGWKRRENLKNSEKVKLNNEKQDCKGENEKFF